MIEYENNIYSIRYLKNICEKTLFFLGESFFDFSKMDKNKCPKMENPKFNLGKNQLCDHN